MLDLTKKKNKGEWSETLSLLKILSSPEWKISKGTQFGKKTDEKSERTDTRENSITWRKPERSGLSEWPEAGGWQQLRRDWARGRGGAAWADGGDRRRRRPCPSFLLPTTLGDNTRMSLRAESAVGLRSACPGPEGSSGPRVRIDRVR